MTITTPTKTPMATARIETIQKRLEIWASLVEPLAAEALAADISRAARNRVVTRISRRALRIGAPYTAVL